jgi:hypothetical protein
MRAPKFGVVIDHVRFAPVPERATFYPDTVSFAADASDAFQTLPP